MEKRVPAGLCQLHVQFRVALHQVHSRWSHQAEEQSGNLSVVERVWQMPEPEHGKAETKQRGVKQIFVR